MSRGELTADVVVIGAGLSGLVTARELVREDVDVVVLEARDRVGGRTLNAPLGEGKTVEVGGQFVGPGQDRVLALANELGIETFRTFDVGDRYLELDGTLRRFSGDAPDDIDPAILMEIVTTQTKLDELAGEVDPRAPWSAPQARVWDSQTAWSWLTDNVRSGTALDMLQAYVRAIWSFDPADVSFLHLLACIHAGDTFQTLLSTPNGAQQDRFVGGSQLLCLRLADELADRVHLDAAVQSATYDAQGVQVHAGELTVHAKRLVVACAPVLASRIQFDPSLPAAREQLAQRMPQGSTIKALAIYPEPFWRADGLSGQAISDHGTVTATFDNSPPDGRPGILLGFIVASNARRLLSMPGQRREEEILAAFERFFGTPAASPDQLILQSWSEDPWTRGCYAGYLTPGGWTSYGPALRAPCGPIHWAGAETATRWIGFMDGAVSAGERAAREVAATIATPAAARV